MVLESERVASRRHAKPRAKLLGSCVVNTAAGNALALHPHHGRTRSGTDNSAPTENLHNKNPSLTLSGKK